MIQPDALKKNAIFKLTFGEDGKSLKASVAERTGLNDERFEGILSS